LIIYKLFERYSRDPHVRGALFSTLKTYRKIRKSKIIEYDRKIIDQLDSLLENNPKQVRAKMIYWLYYFLNCL
jgi:predicted RNase H-like nuclease (RuvC/YqgF family)